MRLKLDIASYLNPRVALLSLVLIMMVSSVALQNVVLYGVFLLLCYGTFAIYNKSLRSLGINEKNFILLLLVAAFFTLPVNIFRTPTSALHFMMVLGTLAAALAASANPKAYASASFIALAFAQLMVLGFLAVHGLDNFPLEEMIPDTSSNGITSYLVCLQVNYCVANLRVNQKASVFTSAVTFFVCVIGYGRGSILAGTAILALSLLFVFQRLRRSHAIIATVVLIGVTAFFLINNFGTIYDYAEANTKLGTGLYDEPRAAMLSEYLDHMTGASIVFGTSFEGLLIDRFYNGNPHNSYIRGHHFLGLFYIVLMTLMVLRPLFTKTRITEKIFYLSMLVILLLRASTEPILFPTPFDLIYFSLFFLLGQGSRIALPSKAQPSMQTAIAKPSHG